MQKDDITSTLGNWSSCVLKWAVTERFSDYLSYTPFTVFIDNNPLTYMMKAAKLNATGLYGVAEFSNYLFEILYCPGKKNGDVDGLSRQRHTLINMLKNLPEPAKKN